MKKIKTPAFARLRQATAGKQNSKLVIISFFVILTVYFIIKNIQSSVFLNGQDRINVVFYGQTAVFYSLGIGDISYIIPIASDTEILVPGGYGFYRVGALGKLVYLEKKPEIFQKTFSAATSSFVDLYFYKKNSQIYYGSNTSFNFFPQMKEILTDEGNAQLLDRLILLWQFLKTNRNRFNVISDISSPFSREDFYKSHLGYFYKTTYRNLKDNVQILYTKSYKTASMISEIIEGEGIRVVDLSQTETAPSRCRVIWAEDKKQSQTALDLARFFNCNLSRGQTEISDIILILGNLEKDWGVD